MKTVLLAGTVPIFLSGIQNVIQNADPAIQVRKLYLKKIELCQALKDEQAQFLILDLSMETRIPENIRCLFRSDTFSKVIVYGNWEEAKIIKALLCLGVNAYLHQQTPEIDSLDAIRELETNDHFLTPEFRRKLADYSLGLAAKNRHSFSITPREKEVLNLIVGEYTTREIAKKLFISSCTAETHRLNLINKFGVKNTAGLVREAVITNLVNL